MSVSRETAASFETYLAMLKDWQARFNLVSPSTLDDAYTRHIDDSLQLVETLPGSQPRKIWVDMGSGAGFPGLVAAVTVPDSRVHLIESRDKKCRFLEAVAANLGIAERVTIHSIRIESMQGPKADIISARACAGLPKLLDWGLRFQGRDTLWVLPKGRRAVDEIEDAKKDFSFKLETLPSRTDPEARILHIRDVKRVRRPGFEARKGGRKRP